MKIALITNSRIPSLTANSIQALKVAQALMQSGHEIRMFAPCETAAASHDFLLAHYGLHLAPPLEFLPSIRLLKRFDFVWHAWRASRRFKPDLIYTWLPQSAVFSLWSGSPVVLEMHADVAGRMGAWWLRQFWLAGGRRVMTVTVSSLRAALQRSIALDTLPEPARQAEKRCVLVAPNGVELEKYENLPAPARARAHLGLRQGLTVGFTGHIYPGRGAELLFHLACQLPQVNFLWVGGSPDLVEFWRARLAEVGASNVTMTGFLNHEVIPLYQAASDVLLMPYSSSISASSGQDIAEVINPMKMFEYMASGRAIISADLPSIREVLNQGNAVFCPAHRAESSSLAATVEAWKAAILSLLSDEPHRLALGAQARRDVAGFSWIKREQRILEKLVQQTK